MNKESIYRIIGYNGIYDDNVKKAIRKLLKENHPDHNGDRKIFELINEVKRELEENKVSVDFKKSKSSVINNDGIDYLYCSKMIELITKKKNMYTDELKLKNSKLANYISEYKKNYQDSLNLESYLLSNSENMSKLNNIKISCIIVIILATIVFLISIWKKELVFFCIFIALAIICAVIVHKAFYIMQKITENNRNKVKNYVVINNNIRKNQTTQNGLKKEINELNKKIKSMENDLRFYNNLLKK